jgi:hypothetical protein
MLVVPRAAQPVEDEWPARPGQQALDERAEQRRRQAQVERAAQRPISSKAVEHNSRRELSAARPLVLLLAERG